MRYESSGFLLASCATVMVAVSLSACQVGTGYGFPDDVRTTDETASASDTATSVESCESDDDCAGLEMDATGCTVAMCDLGYCSVRIQPSGHPCDDGSAATFGDVCDGGGKCAGTTADCGDGRCDLERESCYTCQADCACGLGMICYDSECVATPEDGDGTCEKLEDCGTSPIDCECDDGYACVDAECMECDEACAQDFRVCGDFEGCDCGECDGDLECNLDGRCEIPGECGDGECLTSFEDCENCVEDCGCTDTQGCVGGACKACTTVCRGIDCGMVDGCDCGQPGICQTCLDGKVVTDCDCLCRAGGKECGRQGDCVCGDYDGGCMDRMTCLEGLCMPDCEQVCDDIQCGSIGNCLCARCTKTQVCYDNTCEAATFDDDEYEPNNYPAQAADLGAFTDADGTPDWDLYGAILAADDRDWFTATVADTWGEVLDIYVVLDGMSEDADLNLMVCYRCDSGSLNSTGLSLYDDSFEVASTIENARCFESRRRWGVADEVSLSPTCGYGFDDSGTVWIKVYPAEKADARTDYLIGFEL